jgi:hypothetical protein
MPVGDPSQTNDPEPIERRRLIISTTAWLIVLVLCLFLPEGTWACRCRAPRLASAGTGRPWGGIAQPYTSTSLAYARRRSHDECTVAHSCVHRSWQTASLNSFFETEPGCYFVA